MERQIRRLAESQHGHVTRAQLLGFGLGRTAIHHRVRTGRLIPIHAGVYGVGQRPATPVARAAAAVLACGDSAVLSHGSAAALWGLRRGWTQPLEVTVTRDRNRPNIHVHRSRTLGPRDVRRHLGIRVTSPARTVLDIAPRLTAPALRRTVNDARLSGHLKLGELDELVERHPRHPGARAIRQLLTDSWAPTRSVFEDEFVGFARRFGLPMPEINVRVAGYEVDALFRAEGVIVELDGYQYHSDQGSFERDRERDAATLAAGRLTVRVTWARLTRQAELEAARLHRTLRGVAAAPPEVARWRLIGPAPPDRHLLRTSSPRLTSCSKTDALLTLVIGPPSRQIRR